MNKEFILNAIKNLLNRTVEQGATPEEAAAASEKIRELLLKYNLSLADVPTNDIETSHVVDIKFKVGQRWQKALIGVLARHNLCEIVSLVVPQNPWRWNKKKNQYVKREPKEVDGKKIFKARDADHVILVGLPANIEIVTYLYKAVAGQLQHRADHDFRELYKPETYINRSGKEVKHFEKRYDFNIAFFTGAIREINRRLDKAQASDDKESRALVVTSKTLIDKKIADMFPPSDEQFQTTDQSVRDWNAYERGRQAGREAQMNPGLNSSKAPKQIGG